MEREGTSLNDLIVEARIRARALDWRAFERRFGAGFDAEARDVWDNTSHLEPERRRDEVFAWAMAQVATEASRHRAAQAESVEAERRRRIAADALAETQEAAHWRRPWLKDDPAFRTAINAHGIDAAFHWTPLECVESILNRGIRPRSFLDSHGIWYERHSYGLWTKEIDFANHVVVSIRPQRGMFWQTPRAVLLRVDRRIVARNGAFYVPGNSASRWFGFYELSRRTSVDDLHALFQDPTSMDLIDWQAEVWVPTGIGARRIESIHVRDSSAAALVSRAVARSKLAARPPQVTVDPELDGSRVVSIDIDNL